MWQAARAVKPKHVCDSTRKAPVGSVVARQVTVSGAPVRTLWAAVVAHGVGFEREEALTMGRLVAGLNAYGKGKALGRYPPRTATVVRERRRLEPGAVLHVCLLNRAVPMARAEAGSSALSKDMPVAPESLERYLESRFGERFEPTETGMMSLARAIPGEELAARRTRSTKPSVRGSRRALPVGVPQGLSSCSRFDIGRHVASEVRPERHAARLFTRSIAEERTPCHSH